MSPSAAAFGSSDPSRFQNSVPERCRRSRLCHAADGPSGGGQLIVETWRR